jgi:hypothetical protein
MSVGMNRFEDLFRALHFYAYNKEHGEFYAGAFPTFLQGNSEQGKIYGACLIKKKAADFHEDIKAKELGNPKNPEERFQALCSYAKQKGYMGAFPTFSEVYSEQSNGYGACLIKEEAAESYDISADELGNPKNREELFQHLCSYSQNNDYAGAFPTSLGDYKQKKYGACLIKKGFAEFRDMPFYHLLKLLIRPGDIIYGDEKKQFPGHIAIIVSDKNDKGEDDLVVREAYPVSRGVSNISLKDFCECGGYHPEYKDADKYEHYDEIRILRANCSKEQAEKAAEKAKKIKGYYDWSYLTDVIGLIASLSHGALGLPQAMAMAVALKASWDNEKKWYCSKLVYKAYFRAGFDLYPRKGKCPSPLALAFPKKGEYPYLDVGIPLLEDGKCPWCIISPGHVLKSKHVHEVWNWTK